MAAKLLSIFEGSGERGLRTDRSLLRPYLGSMEVTLNPDLQAKLSRLAADRGSDAQTLVQEAAERFVDYDEWFLREVDKA